MLYEKVQPSCKLITCTFLETFYVIDPILYKLRRSRRDVFWHVKALSKRASWSRARNLKLHVIQMATWYRFFWEQQNVGTVIFQVDDDAKVHKLGQRSNLRPPFKLVEPQKDLLLLQLENKSLKKIADSSSLQRAAFTLRHLSWTWRCPKQTRDTPYYMPLLSALPSWPQHL